jgi:hypothetical protein
MPIIPSPAGLTLSTINSALELYPSLVEKVYKAKLKDPKKVADALKRDEWRFEDLPSLVAEARVWKGSKGSADIKEGGLTKEAVERLVQWKM